MEAIEVKLRKRPQQKKEPESFICKGRVYRVESIGRRWQGEQGMHILVMDARNQVYHLFFHESKHQWYWIKSLDSPTIPMV
jgi:hypothetical protein